MFLCTLFVGFNLLSKLWQSCFHVHSRESEVYVVEDVVRLVCTGVLRLGKGEGEMEGRERERERERGRERERNEGRRGKVCVCVCVCVKLRVSERRGKSEEDGERKRTERNTHGLL